MDFVNAVVLFGNFVIVPGLAYGSQLALGALGLTLVVGVLRFSNFAHGDTMAFGAMITVIVTVWLQSLGVTFGALPTALLAMPFGIVGTALFVLATDRLVYRYYRQKHSPSVVFVIASLGVMLVMHGLVRFIVGPGERRFVDGERFIISARDFKELAGIQEGLAIKSTQAITLVAAVGLIWLLFHFLHRTRTGKSMRAYSDNRELAELSGINPERIVVICWVIAAALATVAGTLYGLDKIFKPFTYFQLLLPMFAAAVVGGLGSPIGAIVGAFVVAFSEIAITYAYKKVLIYLLPESLEPTGLVQLLSTDYKFAVSFGILVVALIFRPTGIFRGQST